MRQYPVHFSKWTIVSRNPDSVEEVLQHGRQPRQLPIGPQTGRGPERWLTYQWQHYVVNGCAHINMNVAEWVNANNKLVLPTSMLIRRCYIKQNVNIKHCYYKNIGHHWSWMNCRIMFGHVGTVCMLRGWGVSNPCLENAPAPFS